MQKGIGHIDLVLEVRDARIPMSSTNPVFDTILGERFKLIVFNKSDLCHPSTVSKVKQAYKNIKNQRVIFTSALKPQSVKQIIKVASEFSEQRPHEYPFINMLLVGLPNVGKSTLVNKLRQVGLNKQKVAESSPFAGKTVKIQTRTKINEAPPIYVMDGPGIVDPTKFSLKQRLRMALVGGLKDNYEYIQYVADYLLYKLNKAGDNNYLDLYKLDGPTNSIEKVLVKIAKDKQLYSSKVLRMTGDIDIAWDLDRAAEIMIKDYRKGHFGKIMIEDLDSLPEFLKTGNISTTTATD